MAELAPVDVASTFAVPDGLDAGVAVSLGIAGLAAWLR
jgi:NADPH:quinone reductase-like Zn-dependent oxidoreductase